MKRTIRKPIIGISGSILEDSGGIFPGYKRAYVNDDYVDSVIKAGGVPLIIPFSEDEEVIATQIEHIDGLILSGGHDVAPINYGQEPAQKLGGIFPERDQFDFQMLEQTRALDIPVLGICRGIQIINVFQGGTLYQDISENSAFTIKHEQNQRPDLVTHEVEIASDSFLSAIFKSPEIRVNSFHHQMIHQVGKELRVVAEAKDGVIEGLEYTGKQWLKATQWHPEMLHRVDSKMLGIFEALVEQASLKTE